MSNFVSLIIWAVIWFILGGICALTACYKVGKESVNRVSITDETLRKVGEDGYNRIFRRKH